MEIITSISHKEMRKDIDWSDKTILIADDIYTNFLLLEAILIDTRAKLIWAKNGMEAVAICLDHENIDLVLMDIQMPEKNGIEATRDIKKIRKDLPIVAQTAYTEEFAENNIMEAGCSQIIRKPIIPDLVIKTLATYL
ncbi:MAG: response regulator [Bacteroidales bacterium]|nr:response regulator [Bacteroidales bacterium]